LLQTDVVLVTFDEPQRALDEPTLGLSVLGSLHGVRDGRSKLVEEAFPAAIRGKSSAPGTR
jgi:hypothetical protein